MEDNRIAIFGSCVIRDCLNYSDIYAIRKYINFVTISSIEEIDSRFSDGVGGSTTLLQKDEFEKIRFRSNFIKTCAQSACDHKIVERLMYAKADWLLLDCLNERIPKLLIKDDMGDWNIFPDHEYFKVLSDFLKEKYQYEQIRFCGLEWKRIEKSYENFYLKITKPGGYNQNRIIIFELYLASEFISDNNQILKYSEENCGYSEKYISEVNSYLRKLYKLMEQLFPNAHIIQMPDNILGIRWHKFGLNPMHFIPECYEYLLNCVDVITGNPKQDNQESLFRELKFRMDFIRMGLR